MNDNSSLSRREWFGRAMAPLAGSVSAAGDQPHTAWLIVALDWEYNDEFSYPTDGFHPRPQVYLDHAQAEAECRKLCDEFFTQTYPTPQEFEPDWALYDCDPATATWAELRAAGFPDPYLVQELSL